MTTKAAQQARYWLTPAGYAALDQLEAQQPAEDDR